MAAVGRARWWLPLRPLLLVVVVAVLGLLFGLGNSAILGGTIATFLMTAAFGGSLYSDLRLLGWFGPALVAEVGLISVLNGPVPLAADLVVVVAVFVAGLMPVLGPRFVTTGVGLGMSAVFTRAMSGSGGVTAVQAFGAPALALAVVVALRVLAGRSDPSGPVRAALADALVDLSPAAGENAVRVVDLHRPVRWISEVTTGLIQYRNTALLLTARRRGLGGTAAEEVDRHLAGLQTEALRLADALRPAGAPAALPPAEHEQPSATLPGATENLVTEAWRGLEVLRVAAVGRDETDIDRMPLPLRPSVLEALCGELRWSSTQLRHAVRTALGMVVALAFLRFQGTPFGVTFLIATYTTMQPTWMDSLRKAGERVVGTLIGAAALGVVVWLELPQFALTGLGVVGLVLGYYFMHSRPMIGNAGLTFMSVALTTTNQALDLTHALLLCLEVSAIGIGIGLVFGFVAVPGVRRPGLREQLAAALAAQRVLLGAVTEALRRGPAPGRSADSSVLGRSARTVAGAVSNLTAYRPGERVSDEQRTAAEWATEALRGMSVTALALLQPNRTTGAAATELADAVDEIARQLHLDREPDLDAIIDRLSGPGDIATDVGSGDAAGAADAAAETRLRVNTMISGLLAVRQFDSTLMIEAR